MLHKPAESGILGGTWDNRGKLFSGVNLVGITRTIWGVGRIGRAILIVMVDHLTSEGPQWVCHVGSFWNQLFTSHSKAGNIQEVCQTYSPCLYYIYQRYICIILPYWLIEGLGVLTKSDDLANLCHGDFCQPFPPAPHTINTVVFFFIYSLYLPFFLHYSAVPILSETASLCAFRGIFRKIHVSPSPFFDIG